MPCDASLKVKPRDRWSVETLLTHSAVTAQLQLRALERSSVVPEIKPLFYKVCTPPHSIDDWKCVAGMFSELNQTIQLSESAAARAVLVGDIREKLQRGVLPTNPMRARLPTKSTRSIFQTPGRVLPHHKLQVEISDYERRIESCIDKLRSTGASWTSSGQSCPNEVCRFLFLTQMVVDTHTHMQDLGDTTSPSSERRRHELVDGGSQGMV